MQESEKSEKSVICIEINKEILYYMNKVYLPFIYTQKYQLSSLHFTIFHTLCVGLNNVSVTVGSVLGVAQTISIVMNRFAMVKSNC